MVIRNPLRVCIALVFIIFFAATAFASMPAFNRFTEGVAAVQGVWYDLDGNEAFSVAGTSFNGRTIRSVTSYGGSAEACNADFCLEGENREDRSYVNITWTPDRRFLLVNGMHCRSSREPIYFESARGVFLGMKKEAALELLGEPTKKISDWQFVYPDITIKTSGGMVVAILLPSGGARLDRSGLGADDEPDEFSEAYEFLDGWDGQESREIGSYGEYLQQKDGMIILSLFK